MLQLLSAIEQSAFCTWVRESASLWAYPGFRFAHGAGMALAAGLIGVIDLRLLGFARQLPLEPFDRFFPLVWSGVWVTSISGLVLFASEATNKITSPLFGLKMLLVLLAIAHTVVLRRVVFRARDTSARARAFATLSLVLWISAIVAGRLMTYLESTGRI